MDNKPAAPEVYWVVGDGTSIGKTTLACALIRALNQAGTPSAGFKPYAAMLLGDLARLVEDLGPAPWRFYGEDSLELAGASPLTSLEMADIVGPTQFLCNSYWPSASLARTGSMALDNVEYFRSEQALPVAERLAILAVLEKTGWPLGAAQPLRTLNFFGAATLSPEKQKLAFDYLVALGALSIVCEGPGRFLPNWQDCPGVNHVISIAEDRAAFFPHADCRVTFSREASLAPASELAAWLHKSRKPSHVARLDYIAEHERREEAADSMVKEFLRISGGAVV